jgi:outer membrane protein TolC
MAIGEIIRSGVLAKKLKTERFPRLRFFIASFIPPTLKFIFIIACAFITFGLTALSQSVQGATVIPDNHTLTPSGPLNFEEGVKIALHQSPYFKKSSLEIDLKRLDETDSRYDLIPPLTFQTYYYLSRPSSLSGNPYNLTFYTNPYNPLTSYYNLQVQKLVTQAAILSHLQVISSGLERLGQFFLELKSSKKLAAYQQDIINLSREKLAYIQNRYSAGTATSLEVKEAQQKLTIELHELERLAFSQTRALSDLKDFLGLKSSQKLTPNLQNASRQVMGSFDPAAATWEQARGLSYQLKILAIKMKIQGYNVNLAISRTLPTILFNYQTPDPLSSTARGLYAGFGLQIPVWDGFKRIRNIARQKAILKQYGADRDLEENNLENKFYEAQENVKDAAFALQLARSQIEFAQLRARRTEISYQAGEVSLPEVLKARQAVLEANKNMVQKKLTYDKMGLAFRQISGDLGHSYVHASSWQD